MDTWCFACSIILVLQGYTTIILVNTYASQSPDLA